VGLTSPLQELEGGTQRALISIHFVPFLNFILCYRWLFTDGGKEINQHLNSRAGLAVGNVRFNSVRYSGTMFVNTDNDDDDIGIGFGYQNNKNFYIVSSSKTGYNQGYWRMTRVHSITGHPSNELQDAIFKWNTQPTSVPGQTEIIWGPHPTLGWEAHTPYKWVVEQRSDEKTIHLQITRGSELIIDEIVQDVNGLAGGRLGVYCSSQQEIIWSRMSTECLE